VSVSRLTKGRVCLFGELSSALIGKSGWQRIYRFVCHHLHEVVEASLPLDAAKIGLDWLCICNGAGLRWVVLV
jgi:hypothetical protein